MHTFEIEALRWQGSSNGVDGVLTRTPMGSSSGRSLSSFRKFFLTAAFNIRTAQPAWSIIDHEAGSILVS